MQNDSAKLHYRCTCKPRPRWTVTPGQPAAAMASLATCTCGRAGIPEKYPPKGLFKSNTVIPPGATRITDNKILIADASGNMSLLQNINLYQAPARREP